MDVILNQLRERRGFNPISYLAKKTEAINEFFRSQKLDSAVVGLSGGVDSSVVYALLRHAMKQPNSPIKRVVGVIVPIHCEGVTGQSKAAFKAIDFAYESDGEYIVVNGSAMVPVVTEQMEQVEHDGPWAMGQLVSILRTPIFYYQAAIMQAQGYKSLVVGTTNKSEGSYIGFFGKASDAMNDLQPIADLYKSEVYKIADLLGVPKEISGDKPRGDVWDGKTDEEMFGATYDELELFLLGREYNLHKDSSEKFYSTYQAFLETQSAKNIQNTHLKNSHKYQVGQPSHFVDILSRKLDAGW